MKQENVHCREKLIWIFHTLPEAKQGLKSEFEAIQPPHESHMTQRISVCSIYLDVRSRIEGFVNLKIGFRFSYGE